MASKSTIQVRLLGDNRDLRKALDDSQSRIGKFASKAGTGLKIAGAAIASAGAAAVIAAPSVLRLGSELEAMGIKASTVFGDSLDDVQAWSKELAPALGLTTAELTGAAASMGDLLKPMGFTSEQAAEMSTEMLDLSGALSAWSGGQQSAAEVAEILSKAMLGEREQLKGLGISISEADVQARLALKGQEDLTGAALAQAKALATQELILEKSTDAQEAWADGSFDAIKAQNAAEASLGELRDSLVTAVLPAFRAALPVVQSVADWLGRHLPGAIAFLQDVGRALSSWWQENWPAMRATVVSFIEWYQANVAPVVEAVSEAVLAAFSRVQSWVEENWPAIRETIDSVIGAIRTVIEVNVRAIQIVWEKFGASIMRYAETAWKAIGEVISGALKIIRGIIQAVTSLIRGDWSGVWDGIKSILVGVWEAMTGIVRNALGLVRLAIEAAWTGITSAFSAIWDAAMSAARSFVSNLVSTITGIPRQLVALGGAMLNAGAHLMSSLVNGLRNGVSAMIGFAADIGRGVIEAIKQAINVGIQAINDFIPNSVGLGPVSVNLPDNPLPTFHAGGIVPGARNQEVPIMALGGERVLSHAEVDGGAGGMTVEIHNYRRDLTPADLDHALRSARLRAAA